MITENDVSNWNDDTGKLYHFPKTYKNFLTKGTQVLYYKGRLKDKSFISKRMHNEPHYFGIGQIGNVFLDVNSSKGDYYAEVINFQRFTYPVLSKNSGEYLEEIPASKKNNYWRNGVRPISERAYKRILSASDLNSKNETNDIQQGDQKAYTSFEGGSKLRYTTTYERDPKLRDNAIEIHGLNCMACGFNFKNAYGDWGAGFIHVHHTKPVAISGPREVNPVTDMVVLCPNCHSMVHRRKNKTLSLEELKSMLRR